MKKNGFTLVELLAILVILGVIAGIAIINISKQTSVSEKQGQTVLNQKIENASKLYAAKYFANDIISGNIVSFTINDLVEDGLLYLGSGECTNKMDTQIKFSDGEIQNVNELEAADCYQEVTE